MSSNAKLNLFFIILIIAFVLVIICSGVEKGDLPPGVDSGPAIRHAVLQEIVPADSSLAFFTTIKYNPKCANVATIEDWRSYHDWKPCAWIIWDNWYEVPRYYPPSKYIRVEICSHCGVIRISPESLETVVKTGR